MNKCDYCKQNDSGGQQIRVGKYLKWVCQKSICIDSAGVDDYKSRSNMS